MTSKPQLILQVAVPVPLRRCFDYLPPANCPIEQLQPGMRIIVPFGRRKLTGLLMGLSTTSDVPVAQLKQAIDCPDTAPLMDPALLNLGLRIADYYHHPIGEVLMTFVPVALRQGEPLQAISEAKSTQSIEPKLSLNPAQLAALDAILNGRETFNTFLLDGVTGSGKTEIYLHAIDAVLSAGKQVLILLPEIGLTPQTLQRFEARFAVPMVSLHSGMTHKKRLTHWLQIKDGSARIIIGTRSAVFAPATELGLIIIDEEHDLSFKQQDSFRYHARDVAILRAQSENIPIILGSATPSLETLLNARRGRYQHLCLPERAGNATLPHFHLTDIRHSALQQGLSSKLLSVAKEHLEDGNQVMLFLNRRGFSPTLLCHHCGWIATCKRCDARMTWHKQANQLICHHCSKIAMVPTRCEHCKKGPLQPTGQGTERLEENLTQLFPNTPIVRIDRDSTRRKGSMEKALASIQDGSARLLTGTQMLAKGHHFPNVTLVAMVDVDGGFFSPDFRGPERMGQLILQVAGRAGRTEKQGTVLIQTHHPDHPLFQRLIQEGYPAFATALLEERELSTLPPYSFFALFRAEAHQKEPIITFLKDISQHLKPSPTLSIMGPVPAPMAKRAGKYRYQLLLQASKRTTLHQALKTHLPQIETLPSGRKVRWSLDIDPLEMH